MKMTGISLCTPTKIKRGSADPLGEKNVLYVGVILCFGGGATHDDAEVIVTYESER